MNNKYYDAFNLTEEDKKEFKFPLLIWSNLDGEDKIVILAENGVERTICTAEGTSIQKYIGKTEEEFNTFLNDSNEGDESQHVFKLIEAEEGNIKWDGLIKEFETKLSKLPYKKGDFEDEIVAELNKNYTQDIKASFMECVYNSIIVNIHALATELIVESIGFLGEFSYQERFRQIIHKNLNKDFNVILGN
jgi:hypothetical protein